MKRPLGSPCGRRPPTSKVRHIHSITQTNEPTLIQAPPPSRRHSQPLDVVLGLLGDELDAFQDVGDVVDASLLHVQHLRGPVQVHHAVGRLRQQVEETLGGQVEGGVVARALRRAPRNCSGRKEEHFSTAAGWRHSVWFIDGKQSHASLHFHIRQMSLYK